jgi:hypothetical protein
LRHASLVRAKNATHGAGHQVKRGETSTISMRRGNVAQDFGELILIYVITPSLKHEVVHRKEYQTMAEAEASLEQFIEAVYNTKRLTQAQVVTLQPSLKPREMQRTAELTCPLVQ